MVAHRCATMYFAGKISREELRRRGIRPSCAVQTRDKRPLTARAAGTVSLLFLVTNTVAILLLQSAKLSTLMIGQTRMNVH